MKKIPMFNEILPTDAIWPVFPAMNISIPPPIKPAAIKEAVTAPVSQFS